jgi:hypothetical protein
MQQTDTMARARKMIEDAGFRFDILRSFAPEGHRPGYAFSVESDRECFGHPMMEVEVAGGES